ncbi:S46 family peptidase [Prolixibacteraceae bacterium JC049]|nr:S46 family peptidase [Prolixibacteraceae bacterium JC049]
MRKFSVLLALMVMLIGGVKADEGMWMPALLQKLNIGEMQKMGLKLSAEDIYSVNNSSLKDAIIIFGRGCTGEMISDKGLILTNHHCGYGAIQQHSSVEHDYLTNGFWAKSFEEEIPTPGLTATFLVRMEDVTERINSQLTDDMSEKDRYKKISEIKKEIVKEAKKDNHYKASVKSLFAGNDFFLFVYEVFTDVRLVGAPPSSVGKYGGDTDNWMWPRHTGDFSMFRVYAGPDGKPAAYSPENKPFKPRHHLPISMKGVKKGDFAMTMGYPGSTDRYLTSWGIQERMDITNQARIDVRGVKQDIWLKDMKASDKVRIQYASKFARSSNYWKNSIGMNKGLTKLKVLDKKRELEGEYAKWVAAGDDARKAKFGEVLSTLENAYEEQIPYVTAQTNLYETLLGGTEILGFSLKFRKLEKMLSSKEVSEEDLKKELVKIKEASEAFYKDYSVKLDQKVFAAMVKVYKERVDAKFLPETYKKIDGKFKGNTVKFADYIFSKSIFTNKTKLFNALKSKKAKALAKDPAFAMAKDVLAVLYELYDAADKFAINIDKGNRLFIDGLRQMKNDKVFYPDANFTMRLSYGLVGDYEPRDAVHYNYFTTAKGILEKYKPGDYEFDLPKRLVELIENKDFGQYADKDGELHVCFTTNNDITGGNSGSPVINANGELFGLAFDGNWEAMSGDIAFETQLQKCINVDIRYVLFIIDKYAGATRLIDEMTLAR